MSRSVSIFICQNCGAETKQFFGRCSSCGEWNSIIEEKVSRNSSYGNRSRRIANKETLEKRSQKISSLQQETIERLKTGYQEFDRVLGGGLVQGSLVLVGGEPGIGKSTLLLQSATSISLKKNVLYVTAEESAQQIKIRWDRIKNSSSNLHILSETNLELIVEELDSLRPDLAIIDSIQALNDENISSTPGSVSQVRECSSVLQKIAKKTNISLIIVGHVTKEGMLAGPKVLEHLVDAVLTFEGDRFATYRLLRAVKNRYGATNEIGVFDMQGEGLKEVENPSELFLNNETATGVATTVAFEGTRPLVIDLQALINPTSYASPRRTTTGVENNRLHQILAVIEKHMNLPLSRYDCYLAVAGGLTVDEPAADLGIAAAIVSSYKNIKLTKGTVLIGEIGLGGQLRTVRQIQQRIQECIRLGFNRLIIPQSINSEINVNNNIQILKATDINEALDIALKL